MARTTAQIQADLDTAYAARRAALLGQSYTLDTGQGRQTVTRADLRAIENTIAILEAELADTSDPNPAITFERDSV